MKQERSVAETRIEDVARQRLRGLRLARGWTLDELASVLEGADEHVHVPER